MSNRLFWVLAVVAVAASVASVLVVRNRGGDSRSASAVVGTVDPALTAKMRRVAFYDWEPNVIGPGGRRAPGDPAVTGGRKAGRAGALSLYDAVLRAARRPARVEPDNARQTTLHYAVDPARRRVFGRGAATRAQALAAVPAAARGAARVYEVKPDTTIVAAEGSRTRWFVLKDDVALPGSDIRDPRRAIDQSSGRSVVNFAFTEPGLVRFQQLTQALARRGAASSLSHAGDDPARHNQHFAVVSDGRIVALPFIDFRVNPDGLDARAGSQLAAPL